MIRVFDNVVSKKLAQKIEDYTFSSSIKWELEKATMSPEFKVKDPNLVEFIQFRNIIKHMDQIFDNNAYSMLIEIFKQLSLKEGIMFDDPFRVKYNLLPKIEKFKELQYNTPHIDGQVDHYGMIYYVCDSDGDTVIFDQTKKEYDMHNASKFKKFTIKKRVSPKKGRLVLFDGDYYHTSSHPTENDLRCVININSKKEGTRIL